MIRSLALISFLAAVPAFAAPQITPGEWEVRSKVTSIAVSGMSPEMMQAMKGKGSVIRHCITPEQAEKTPEQLFKATEGTCSYSRFSMKGGRLDAVMQCAQPHGKMIGTIRGSYTPVSYQMVSEMKMTGPHGKMAMTSVGSGKRIGACRK